MKVVDDLVFPCLESPIHFHLSSLVKNYKDRTERLTLFPNSNNSTPGSPRSLPVAKAGLHAINKRLGQEWALIPQWDGISYAIQSVPLPSVNRPKPYYLSCQDDGFVTIKDSLDSSEQLWELERIVDENNNSKNNFIFKVRSRAFSNRVLAKVPGFTNVDADGVASEEPPIVLAVNEEEGQQSKEARDLAMWRMEFVTGELLFVSNVSYNRRLRCDVFGNINLDKNWKGWEVWRFIEAGNNHLYISSWTHQTRFLACHANGTIQTVERGGKDKLEDDNPVAQNQKDENFEEAFLATNVDAAAPPTIGVRWKIVKRTPNGVLIQSAEHGYYLCARAGMSLCAVKSPYMADFVEEEELKFIDNQTTEPPKPAQTDQEKEDLRQQAEDYDGQKLPELVTGIEWSLHAGHSHVFYITTTTTAEASEPEGDAEGAAAGDKATAAGEQQEKDGEVDEAAVLLNKDGESDEGKRSVFISSRPEGEACISENRNRWEEWRLVKAGKDYVSAGKNGGLYYIHSEKHERFLGVDSADPTLVRTSETTKESELWDVERDDVEGGYIISSYPTGRNLIVDVDTGKLTTSPDNLQSWSLDPRMSRALTGNQLAVMSGAGVAAAALCMAAPLAVVMGAPAMEAAAGGSAAAAAAMAGEVTAGTAVAGLLGSAAVGTTAAVVVAHHTKRQGKKNSSAADDENTLPMFASEDKRPLLAWPSWMLE